MIDSLRALDEADLFSMLQSVFLSYGAPDVTFAERLNIDLVGMGVKTWFFPKDAIPGSRIHHHLQTQILRHDRAVVCCSEASLCREGVLHEIEEILEREAEEGGTEVLIPIILSPIFDSGSTPPSWWPTGKEHVYRTLRRRVAADFQGAMSNSALWADQMRKLMAALRKQLPRAN